MEPGSGSKYWLTGQKADGTAAQAGRRGQYPFLGVARAVRSNYTGQS
jgi:hypothetical protein